MREPHLLLKGHASLDHAARPRRAPDSWESGGKGHTERREPFGRVFGTEKTYYDFTKKEVITEGLYRQTNNKLRVEINEDIEYKNIDAYTLPLCS